MEQRKDVLSKILSPLTNFLTRKRGLWTSAISLFLFFAIFLTSLIFTVRLPSNPGIYIGEEFMSVRAKTLESGQRVDAIAKSIITRSKQVYGVSHPFGESSYISMFSKSDHASDWFGLRYEHVCEKIKVIAEFSTTFYLDDVKGKDLPFSYDLDLYDSTTGEDLYISFSAYEEGGSYVISADYLLNKYSDEANALYEKAARETLDKITPYLNQHIEESGFASAPQALKLISDHYQRFDDIISALFIIDIIFSTLTIISFGALSFSLIARGMINEQDFDIKKETEALPPPILEEPSNFATRLKKMHLRPLIKEWPIRIVGLSLLFIGSLFTLLSALATKHSWGEGWTNFFTNFSLPIESILSLGNFILAICIVNIIAETHYKLHRTAFTLFGLGLIYYVITTLFMFFLEISYPSEAGVGELVVFIFQLLLPGNIFLGIGIFCHVGFFLFSTPDPKKINRRAFRFCSAIPTVFALFVLAFSYLFNSAIFFIPYWISNLLFIKDPSFLIGGIGYEFIVFLWHLRMKKKYGENYLFYEEREDSQMMKNIMLCILILTLQIAAFAIPLQIRKAMKFSATYTVIGLSIPLFLLQKPAGKNRKGSGDILYYALFFAFTFLPSLLGRL